MPRLGYTRYVAQGGDVGAAVTDVVGRQAPEDLLGIHMNRFVPALINPGAFSAEFEEERAAADAINAFRTTGKASLIEQNTRPQTIGYALLDSPIALAAWMLDHDTDAYYKISSAFVAGKPSGNLTRDHIFDDITTYWLTGTGASAARSYWEGAQAGAAAAAAGQAPPPAPWDSRRSPARSGGPRAAGSSRRTQPSPTSTTPAATSPRGRSRSCSPPSSGPHPGRFVSCRVRAGWMPLLAGEAERLNFEPLGTPS